MTTNTNTEFTCTEGLDFLTAAKSGCEMKRRDWVDTFQHIGGRLINSRNGHLFDPIVTDILAKDWVVMRRAMTFADAAGEQSKGANIARLAWMSDPPYESVDNEILLLYGGKDQDNLHLTVEDITAEDWVVISTAEVVPH